MADQPKNSTGAEAEALNQQYEQLVENSPMGMFFYELRDDDTLVFTRANPAAGRLLGVDTEQFIGKAIEEAFPPLGDTEIPQRFRSAAENGVAWSTERVDYEDEQISGAFEVHAFQTNPRNMVCLFLDITNRKRNEAALRESETKFRMLTETITDWVWEVDSSGIYTYASPQVERILGYAPEEIVGKKPSDFMPPAEAERINAVVGPLTEGGQPISQLENRNLTRDGREVVLETSGMPFHDENGDVAGYRGIDRDITERHRQEERLRQSQKMQAIGQLAGGIAHDFNNQLTGIAGFADLLLEETKSRPHLREYAEGILLSVKRASDLTSQLLAFARKGNYLTLKVDLTNVIEEVASLLSRVVDKRIEIHCGQIAPCASVCGDPSLLQSAILNLGLNARDAMPDGGVLTLSSDVRWLDERDCRVMDLSCPAGRYAVITVADTGIGMSEQTQKRIFEPFFTTKEPGKGTGMGMAAVYGTVKTHGGAIRVESRQGEGTRVEMLIPFTDGQCPEEGEVSAATPQAPVRGCHILLVDDEPSVCESTRSVLERNGCRVSVARNGREAVDLFRETHDQIDVVLLDMVMPEMGGREAFLALRDIDPGIDVLVTSGYSVAGEAQDLLEKGARGFIQKPYRNAELLQAVLGACRTSGHLLRNR